MSGFIDTISGSESFVPAMVGFEHYSGKRGYLEHLRSRLLYSLGAYRQARRVRWANVQRLVFVCKGNICRSPYAAEKSRLLGVPAISFGLEAKQGATADAAAVRNAGRRGVDLSPHRSTVFDLYELQGSDLVIVFEPKQWVEIRRRIGGPRSRLTLLGIWSKPTIPYIQDPYGRNDDAFQRCYTAIDTHVLEVVRRVREAAAIRFAAQRHERGHSEEYP